MKEYENDIGKFLDNLTESLNRRSELESMATYKLAELLIDEVWAHFDCFSIKGDIVDASIVRLKRLHEWESYDCGHLCEYTTPYGFVPEAGCPIHDIGR